MPNNLWQQEFCVGYRSLVSQNKIVQRLSQLGVQLNCFRFDLVLARRNICFSNVRERLVTVDALKVISSEIGQNGFVSVALNAQNINEQATFNGSRGLYTEQDIPKLQYRCMMEFLNSIAFVRHYFLESFVAKLTSYDTLALEIEFR